MTADPHGAGIRWHDVSSGDPDPLDAIPRPIAGLPDITGRGCWRHRLDYGGRWRYPDPEPDPGERRSCRGRQQGRHEGEGEDSPSAHGMASYDGWPRCRGRRVATLTTVNCSRDFPIR